MHIYVKNLEIYCPAHSFRRFRRFAKTTKNDAKMATQTDQKSFKNCILPAQRSIFGAVGPILEGVGNASFFGSLLGLSNIDKNSSLELSGRIFRFDRPASQLQHGDWEAQGSLGGVVSKRIEDLMKNNDVGNDKKL